MIQKKKPTWTTIGAICILALAAILLGGCSRSSDSAQSAGSGLGGIGEFNGKPLAKIDVSYTFKFPDDFRIERSRADIEKQWGQPVNVTTQQIGGQTDAHSKAVRTELHYDGVSFFFFTQPDQSRELLVSTTISDPKYAIDNGMRVGMYKSVVLKRFGEPTFVQDNQYVYSAGVSPKDKLSKDLYIPGDTVEKIVIYPEMD